MTDPRAWFVADEFVESDRRACPTQDLASVIANASIDGCPMDDEDPAGRGQAAVLRRRRPHLPLEYSFA